MDVWVYIFTYKQFKEAVVLVGNNGLKPETMLS